jgi:endonuclease YncB( thermonuclease family)
MTSRLPSNLVKKFRSVIRLILIVAAALVAYMISERVPPPAEGWTTIADARYVQGRHSDGDSIEAFVNGERNVFRLYFVDTVERSATAFDRRDEQAGYFGDPPLSEPEALELAREASAMTKEALADGFTVLTKWDRVNPDSDNPSIRAFVVTKSGRDLSELLVEQGLALIKGERSHVDHPDGRSARDIERKLVEIEERAREKGVGGWARRKQARIVLPAGVFAASDTRGIEAQRGRHIKVRGRVSRVGEAGGGSIVFINFDGTGRDGFVAVVRERNGRYAGDLPPGFPNALARKEIEVEGEVTSYEGTPQIEVETGRQIRILGGAGL